MSNIGWISIHRKIAESWIWEAKPFSYGQAWVDILLECNHRDKKILIGKTLVSVSRGQSANSRRTWGKRWGWSKSAVDHFLNLLEFDKMIQTENVHVTTRITVINYDTYQSTTATGHTAEEPREGHEADTNNKETMKTINDSGIIFTSMTVPNLLNTLYNKHGIEAVKTVLEILESKTPSQQNSGAYVRTIIGNTDFSKPKSPKQLKTADIYRELPDD